MNRLGIIFIFSVFSIGLEAQRDVRIGLFQEALLNSFVFHCVSGEYMIEHSSGQVHLNEGGLMYFSLVDNQILMSDGDLNFGYYQRVEFKDLTGEGIFRVRPVEPSGEGRNYQGELELAINHRSMLLVNIVDFNKYLAGVVEAEGGPSAQPEFYKAQAVLCRTYAVKNWNAHREEGFNLCDHTHCQAYKGMSELNPDILHAVLSTHDIFLTARFLRLADAVYHSNSGGETQRASDIWPGGADYLQAIIDPFSLNQPNSNWEKSMQLEMWRNYLISQGMSAALNADPESLLVRQPHRRVNFVLEKDTLRILRIREDLNLRSAFFDMELTDEEVVFKGRGFGHGVGMSQEGAMNMARQNFSYSDILRFYYHQVQIRDIHGIPVENLPEEFR